MASIRENKTVNIFVWNSGPGWGEETFFLGVLCSGPFEGGGKGGGGKTRRTKLLFASRNANLR